MDELLKAAVGAWNVPMWVKYKDPYKNGDGILVPNWQFIGKMLPFKPNEKGQTIGFSLYLDGAIPMQFDKTNGIIKPVELRTYLMEPKSKGNGNTAKAAGLSPLETPFGGDENG